MKRHGHRPRRFSCGDDGEWSIVQFVDEGIDRCRPEQRVRADGAQRAVEDALDVVAKIA
jgi:hypothetical protein